MAEVIILENDKYTIIDSETAKNENLQIVYSTNNYNYFAKIYLKNGLYIKRQYNSSCKEKNLSFLSVHASNHTIDMSSKDSISELCSLANQYNNISMTGIIQLVVENENRHSDYRAQSKLRDSKKEILQLSKQIQELKEITTKEFLQTNSKIRKKR